MLNLLHPYLLWTSIPPSRSDTTARLLSPPPSRWIGTSYGGFGGGFRVWVGLLLLCAVLPGFSQPAQTFQWGVKAGGSGADRVAGIASMDNNLYVTGQFGESFASGNQTVANESGGGMFLLRLDKNGNTNWVQAMTGSAENKASRITTSGENILVGGTLLGSVAIGKSGFAGDGQALFVSSWTEKGKTNWMSRLPYSGFATLDVLETTAKDDLLVGGLFQGTLQPEGFEQVCLTDKRAYLMTLSSDGKPKALLASTGKGSHRLVSATTANDGGLLLLFSISGDFGFGNLPAIETPRNMEYGLALVKTSPSGEAVWMKLFAGTGYFEGVKVLALPTGDALVCANYTSPVTINDTLMGSKGNMETALLLFDAEGKLKKAKTLASPVAVRALDAMFARNGNVLVTGYFRQEYTTKKFEVKSRSSWGDLFLLQTDANLNETWHDEPGENAASFSKAVTLDQEGNIVLAGAFNGKLNLQGKSLVSDGNDDILVARYYNCLQKKAMIAGDPFVCEGGKTELKVVGDYATYLWNGQWGQSSLTVTQPGTYTVMAYDKTGCAAADTVEVKSLPKPDLGLPPTITVYTGQPVLLTAAEGFTSYRWGDGLTTRQREVGYDSKQTPLDLTVSAISSAGCTATDTVTVKFAKAETTASASATYLHAWPNPVDEKLWWYLDIPVGNTVLVQLCDEKGATTYLTELKDYTTRSVQTIDMARMTPGSYLLSLRVAGQTFIQKIVKK